MAELREHAIPVVPHGVRLSLGGAETVEAARVTHLAACASALAAPLVSEHIAFVRAGGREAGHLLPVPRSREALDVLTTNARRAHAELDVPQHTGEAPSWHGPGVGYATSDGLSEIVAGA